MDANKNKRFATGCNIIVLALWLTGCREDPNLITTDRSLNGTLNVPLFSITAGATVSVASDLTINADGDIFIDGNIQADDNPDANGNGNGPGITLRSHGGDIHISGEIHSGDGADGDAQAGRTTATGLPGRHGGNITIIATGGEVIVGGSIITGKGGNGGSATAVGADQLVYAESGAGGDGGNVSILAAKRIDISNVATGTASIEAGDGGDSGSAEAEVQSGDPLDSVVEETTPNNGANTDGGDEVASPELNQPETVAPAATQTTAQARALRGGDGGKITLKVTNADGEILLQGDIEAGDGGDTGSAMASGATVAKAESATAAKGANVDVVISDLTKLLSFNFPEAGDGGNNGVTAGPVQAFAIGTVAALAEVKGGGAPGQVTEQGARISSGTGGSTGHARADIPGISNLTPGRTHFDETPAPAIQAQAP